MRRRCWAGCRNGSGFSAWRASRIDTVTSMPTRSMRANGPIGMLAPAFMAASMSSWLATPRSSSRTAEFRYGNRSALTTKPATSRTSIGSFPQDRAKARAVSTASSVLVMARTTSTSPIIGAGLKKWMPTTCPGRLVATAMSTTGSVDVLVARMAWGAQIRSRVEKSSFLTARSSTTDSTTRSQAASSSRSVMPRTSARAASRSASASRPLSTCLPMDFSRPDNILSAPAWDRLRSTTSYPFLQATSAMPEPIVPEPTIPTRLMVIGAPSPSAAGNDAVRLPAETVQIRRVGSPSMDQDHTGTLALVGGAEWRDGCRKFDAALLEAAGAGEVLVLPTAAAFENPRRAVETARHYFEDLGARVSGLMVLGRTEADDEANAEAVRAARFVYIGGGSPMHLRSVLKGSRLWEALVEAWNGGAVLAASSAG